MDNLQVLVIDWLKTFIDTDLYTISTEKPKTPGDKYILVDRTRGAREAMVLDRAEILIEVYDKDDRLAAANQADAIADKIVELESFNANITHADINSVVSLDDLIGGYRRYQVYCDVYHRR